MDLALWDPLVDQVACGSICQIGSGWHYDFHIGYGLDVIEENVLNEKSCIEVLKILITKADTEIMELEDDLVILQSQLAWADKEWSEICSAILRQKIDCLDVSIRRLQRNMVKDEHDFGVCLPTHKEPAQRMHEILKGLLSNYFQAKDKQHTDTTVQVSSLDSSAPVAVLTTKDKMSGNFIPKQTTELEANKHGRTPRENVATQKSSLKPRVKRRDNLGPPPNTMVQKLSSNAVKRATSNPKEYGRSMNPSLNLSGAEVMEKGFIHSIPISNLSLKPEKIDVEEKDKPSAIPDSETDALKQETGESDANSRPSKGTETAPKKIDTSKSSSKKEKKTIKAPRRMDDQKASLVDSVHNTASLLLELLKNGREDATQPRQRKKQSSPSEQVQKAELGAVDDQIDSNLSLKPQRHRLKRKRQSNPEVTWNHVS